MSRFEISLHFQPVLTLCYDTQISSSAEYVRHAKRILTLIFISLTVILILYQFSNTHWATNLARLDIYALCVVIGERKEQTLLIPTQGAD
jgi:hypothetical protein